MTRATDPRFVFVLHDQPDTCPRCGSGEDMSTRHHRNAAGDTVCAWAHCNVCEWNGEPA